MEAALIAGSGAFVSGMFGVIMWFLNRNERKRAEAAEAAKKEAAEEREEIMDILKTIQEDQSLGREADLVLLYDKLDYLCPKALKNGGIHCDQRKNIIFLYDVYDRLGGNHGIKDKYLQTMELPVFYE